MAHFHGKSSRRKNKQFQLEEAEPTPEQLAALSFDSADETAAPPPHLTAAEIKRFDDFRTAVITAKWREGMSLPLTKEQSELVRIG